MKRVRFWAWSLLLLGSSGCDESALEARTQTASSGPRTAVETATAPATVAPSYAEGTSAKDCEEYVAALERCLKNTPEPARPPLQSQLDRQKEALAKASEPERRAMAPGCRMGLQTLAQNPSCKP